jgi:hypothetical protein
MTALQPGADHHSLDALDQPAMTLSPNPDPNIINRLPGDTCLDEGLPGLFILSVAATDTFYLPKNMGDPKYSG